VSYRGLKMELISTDYNTVWAAHAGRSRRRGEMNFGHDALDFCHTRGWLP